MTVILSPIDQSPLDPRAAEHLAQLTGVTDAGALRDLYDDSHFERWSVLFPSTAGPFIRPGMFAGQAFTQWTIEVSALDAGVAVFTAIDGGLGGRLGTCLARPVARYIGVARLSQARVRAIGESSHPASFTELLECTSW